MSMQHHACAAVLQQRASKPPQPQLLLLVPRRRPPWCPRPLAIIMTHTQPPAGCSASPVSEDNLYVWAATIFGPEGTPW